MAGAPLFRGGKRVSESRQILLHLVIVGRLNLGNLIENERPVVGKNVQSVFAGPNPCVIATRAP
jgi:hypothetical protein